LNPDRAAMTPPLPPSTNPDDARVIQATFESAPDGLVVVAVGGRVVAMNASFMTLWGLSPGAPPIGDVLTLRQLVAPQLKDPDAFLHGLPTHAIDGQSVDVTEFEHCDGRILERQVAPLGDAGIPGAVVARWRDVTRQRVAERALVQLRARTEAVFDHALNAILLTDDQGRYLDANAAACTLLDRSRDELLRLTVAEVTGLDAEQFSAVWADFLRQGKANGLVALTRKDSSRPVARFSSVANIQPGVHLSILSDVSDEVRIRQRELETTAQMDMAMVDADIVFWRVDLAADDISSANPQWLARSLGYAPGEIAPGLRAWDELVHPDDAASRHESWRAHVQGRSAAYESEFRLRHKDGQWRWMLARGRAIERDANGRALLVVGSRVDITRRKQAEQVLEQQAFTDSLTGTLTRRRFLELADVEVSRGLRHGQPVALLMVDLDHFKSVNDRHGHAGGDAVLQDFVKTARAVIRGSDLLGRVGGEEFAALLPQTDLAGAAALAQRLQTLVRARPVLLDSGTVAYTVSIGVATLQPGASPARAVESLMLAADVALYRAKSEGRDRVLLADGP